jgi:hypothetical protein
VTSPQGVRLDSAGAAHNVQEYASAVESVLIATQRLNAGVDGLVASLQASDMAPAVANAGEGLKNQSNQLSQQQLEPLREGLSVTNVDISSTDSENAGNMNSAEVNA